MPLDETRPSLLSRVRDPSDDAAWSEFNERYGELILRYALVRGLRHDEAEDIRQTVMLNLSQSLRKFDYDPARGRFRGYLRRCVATAIQHYCSRPKLDRVALDSSMLEAISPEVPDEADAAWNDEWMNHHIRLAMHTIREAFEARSVAVFDRLLEGRETEDVAAEFGIAPQAVHKVKQRIRDRLNELIAKQIRAEDAPNEPFAT